MKISELQEELERLKQKEGDIQVTCTGSFLPDGFDRTEKGIIADVFETTVSNLVVREPDETFDKKRVRLYL